MTQVGKPDFSSSIWDTEHREQDVLTGVWYPVVEMVKIKGKWYHRDNVDSDLLETRTGSIRTGTHRTGTTD